MRFPPVTPELAEQGREIAKLVAALPSPLPRVSMAEATQAFVEFHSRYNQFQRCLPSYAVWEYHMPYLDILTAFFAVYRVTEHAKVYNEFELRGALKMLDSAIRYVNQTSTYGLAATDMALRRLLTAGADISEELRSIDAVPAIDESHSATRLLGR